MHAISTRTLLHNITVRWFSAIDSIACLALAQLFTPSIRAHHHVIFNQHDVRSVLPHLGGNGELAADDRALAHDRWFPLIRI
jgi:hypothetical protein